MNRAGFDCQGRCPNPSPDLCQRPPGYIFGSCRRRSSVDLLLLAWRLNGRRGGEFGFSVRAIRALHAASVFHLLPEMVSPFLGRGEKDVSWTVININLLCFCHSFRLGANDEDRNETVCFHKRETEVGAWRKRRHRSGQEIRAGDTSTTVPATRGDPGRGATHGN